ncbi:hypothetical protein [Subdoligranulum variabile]|uniref:hypothetical protein n=1 Tax=Subdoligranulum variabile TaxID=214851 RepID=UPI00294311A2|nr:hypothetical protein [Subdoligranulum variabile]
MKRHYVFLVILIAIILSSCADTDKNELPNENAILTPESSISEETATTDSSSVETEKIEKTDGFIEQYNQVAPTPITDISEVDVTDKESGHYRTEFRLSAFLDSYAKTGYIADSAIDIVSYGWLDVDIRVYVTGADLDRAKEVIKAASPILDSDLTESDIQEVLDYLDEHKSANGYYYGKIGLLYDGSELMLKVE